MQEELTAIIPILFDVPAQAVVKSAVQKSFFPSPVAPARISDQRDGKCRQIQNSNNILTVPHLVRLFSPRYRVAGETYELCKYILPQSLPPSLYTTLYLDVRAPGYIII